MTDQESPAPVPRRLRSAWHARGATGIGVALLLVGIVVLERFDAARDVVSSVRDDAGTKAAAAAGPSLTFAWLVATVLAVAVATFLALGLVDAAERKGEDQRKRAKWVAAATIGLWAAWSVSGAVVDHGLAFRTPVHFAIIGLLVATLVVVARDVVGDVPGGWKRASVVRVHMLLLALVYAVVFVVPLTADQSAEVLRAWGHDAWPRVLAGVAGALLLGVAIRGSARRLLALNEPAAERSWLPWCVGGTVVPALSEPRKRAAEKPWLPWCAGGAVVVAIIAFFLHALAATVGLLLGAVAVAASKPSGRVPVPASLGTPEKRLADSLGLVPLLILTAGLVDATVDSWLLSGSSARWRLTAITLVVVALFAVLTGRAHTPAAGRAKLGDSPVRLVGAALAGAVLGLLAGAGARWFGDPAGTVTAGALLFVAIALALRWLGDDAPLGLSTAGGVAAGTTLSIYLAPVSAPRTLGVLGCAFVIAAGIVVALHGPAIWAAGRDLRHASWMQPWPKTVPLVALLAVWIALAFVTAPKTPHQARTVARTTGAVPLPVADAISHWMEQATAGHPGGTVPMLLVGASGGGTKAAYWTSLVLDCVIGGVPPVASDKSKGTSECGPPDAARGPARLRHLFLTSSVSGGSIGVLDFLGHLAHDPALGDEWVDDRVGREVLSPLTAWGLVHDLPAFLLGFQTNPNRCAEGRACWSNADRAFVQEAAIAGFGDDLRRNPGEGILSADTGGPVPIFNGTLNGAVGRYVTSPLELAPLYPQAEACRAQHEKGQPAQPVTGALDAHDVLQDTRDLPLVTAALLSARFPFLEPPGRVGSQAAAPSGCPTKPGQPLTAVRVRDGGYVENTGLLTIVDLLPRIRAAVDAWRPAVHVPIVVLSIDDDPVVSQPVPQMKEGRVSPTSVATRVSDGYLTRKARDTLSSCQIPDVTYVRISPEPHVGAHAATGWEISTTGRRLDLGRALAAGSPGAEQVSVVRRMLDGTSTPTRCQP